MEFFNGTVKEFIERISSVKGIEISSPNEFIEDYLKKIKNLSERKGKNIDIDFLRENLERNVKYIIDVTYTDEELKLKEQSESYNIKQGTGARPGQYLQGRIVFSNISNYILRDHETTHAARMIMLDENDEHIRFVDRIDDLPFVTNTFDFLMQFPNTYASAGYDKSEADKDCNLSEPKNSQQLSDLTEICTESIAGMINEPDEKTFANFSIPTSKMSAITFFRDTRDLLIMAIGSDDFIFDMLSRDSDKGLENLNEKMKQYKEDASIIDYLKISGEYAKYDGRIERAKWNNEEPKQNDETERNKYLSEMENYITDIFISRMKSCDDKDKIDQIKYFQDRLQTQELKNEIESLLIELSSKGKNGIEDCLNDDSLRISTEQEATKVVRETVLDEEKEKKSLEDVELPK